MRKLVGITAVAFLAGASLAMAQTVKGTGPSAQGNASTDSRTAPVGHLQPRREAAPSEDSYQKSAEDKALDRKIKSICKGC